MTELAIIALLPAPQVVAARTHEIHVEPMGLIVEDLTPARATELGLIGPSGVLVTTIDAARAEPQGALQIGDQLMFLDGAPIASAEAFAVAVGAREPNVAATLGLARARLPRCNCHAHQPAGHADQTAERGSAADGGERRAYGADRWRDRSS